MLVDRDFRSYWDGRDPFMFPELWRQDGMQFSAAITPRCCERCAEDVGCKSV